METYKTGRSRTLTFQCDITAYAVLDIETVRGHFVTTYTVNGNVNVSCPWGTIALSFGVRRIPIDPPPDFVRFQGTLAITLALDTSPGTTFIVDVGSPLDVPIGGSSTLIIPGNGTVTGSQDVEEWVDIIYAPFPSGSSIAVDPPAHTTVKFYEKARSSGYSSISGYGNSLSGSYAGISPLPTAVYEVDTGLQIDVADGSATWSAVSILNNTILSAPVSFTDSDGSGSHSYGNTLTVISASRQISSQLLLPKSYALTGRIQALSTAYPDPIDVDITDHAFGGAGVTTTIRVTTGDFESAYTQHYYSINSSFPHDSPHELNEMSALTGQMNVDSLSSLGEDTDDTRILLHGWSWDAMSISQIGSVDVDASPSMLHWTAGTHTSISGTGPLNITVNNLDSGSVSSPLTGTRSAPDPLVGTNWQGVSFAGYRYLRLNLTATLLEGESMVPARLTLGSKYWDLTVKDTGYIDLDLCCPTNLSGGAGTTEVDAKDSQWTWTGESGGPYSVTDSDLWGVSNVSNFVLEQLATNHTYTLTSVQLFRRMRTRLTFMPGFKAWLKAYPEVTNESDTTTTTYYRRFLDGDTDGRRSREQTDYAWIHVEGGQSGVTTDTYSPVSIASMVASLQASTFPATPTDGWSATDLQPAPPSSCPDTEGNFALRNCFLNSDRDSTYLGGAGLYYDGKRWKSGIDLKTMTTLTVPAQILFDTIDWYPGCGDVWGWSDGGYGTALHIAANKIMRGNALGIVANSDGKSVRGNLVKLKQHTTGVAAGQGVTDRLGEYETGLYYAIGQQSYDVSAIAPTLPNPSTTQTFLSRYRRRVAFSNVSASKNCCQQLFDSDNFLFPFAMQSGDNGRLPVADGRGQSVIQGPGFSLPSIAGSAHWQLFQYSALPDTEGPFGFGWRASWPLRLCEATTGTAATGYVTTITMEREDGNAVRYIGNTTGPGATPPTTFTADSPRLFDTLLRNTDGTLDETRFLTGTVFHYPAAAPTTLTSYCNLISLSYYRTVRGQTVSFDYDSNGNLTTITEPNGRQIHYGYDTSGVSPYVQSVTDWASRAYQFGYDGNGNLTQITDPNGAITSFDFDIDHNLIAAYDANGIATRYTYDDQNRVISRTVGAKPTAYYQYSGSDTIYIDPLGHTWTTTQDSNGNVTQAIDPLGATRNALFTAKGLPYQVGDALNRLTSLSYNTNGSLTQHTNPNNETDLFTYDSYGNCTLHVDPMGRRTTMSFGADPSLRSMASQVTPASTTYTFGYNSWGALTSVTDPLNHTTSFDWDVYGCMTKQTDPLTHTRNFAYDTAGNLTTLIDEEGRPFTFTFDPVGRQLTRSDAMGGYWQTAYDPVGNILTQTDPLGNQTNYRYNDYNQPTVVTDARNNRWETLYDDKGRPTGTRDPLNNSATLVYDSADRLTTAIDGMGRAVQYQLDLARQLTTVIDTSGKISAFHHDAAGRIDRHTDPAGLQTAYAYYADGQINAVQDTAGLLHTQLYDAAGMPTTMIAPDGARVVTSYDALSRVSTLTDARGHNTRYLYDAVHRMTTLIDATSRIYSTSYDKSGRVSLVQNPSGTWLQTYYDAAGRIASTLDNLQRATSFTFYSNGLLFSTQDAVGNIDYRYYDPNNNLVTYTDYLGKNYRYLVDEANRPVGSIDPLGNNSSLQYNAAHQPTTYTDALHNQWANIYDVYGRLWSTVNPLQERTTVGYDTYGRYSSTKTPDGSLVTQEYDSAGRPSTFTDGRGYAFAPSYDAYGRQTGFSGPNGYRVSLDLSHVYDPLSQIGTIDALNHRTTVVSDAMNRPVTYVDALGNQATLEYDSRGNLQSLTDPMHRTTQWKYDAYSRLTTVTDAGGNDTAYRYDDDPTHKPYLGRLWYTLDPDLHAVTRHYDSYGRLDAIIDPLGHRTTTIFDSIGRVSATQDQKGYLTSFQYDALHRVHTVTKPSGAILKTDYDALGRISQLTDPYSAITTILHDNLLRQVTVWTPDNARVTKTYDPTGNLVAVRNANSKLTSYDYDGMGNHIYTGELLSRNFYWGYDSANRLISYTDAKGQQFTFSYTDRNQISVEYLPGHKFVTHLYNASGQITTVLESAGTHSYDYDNRGLLHSESHPGYPAGAETFHTYNKSGYPVSLTSWMGEISYGRDERGLLTSVTDPGYPSAGIAGGTTSYSRDERGQVTQAVYPNGTTTETTYDTVGLPSRLRHLCSSGLVIEDVQYTRNLLNLPTSKSTLNDTIQYDYNAVQQLVTETSALYGQTEYVYDMVGRRTSMQTPYDSRVYQYDDGDQLNLINTTLLAIPRYRINCGGGPDGNFGADAYYSAGGRGIAATVVDTTHASSPAPMTCYMIQRQDASTLLYTVANLVASHSYTVRLHFAEIQYTSAGHRLFNIQINGTTVATNYDIFVAAGAANRSVIQEYTATADSSGKIVVTLVPVTGSCALAALEIKGSATVRINCGGGPDSGTFSDTTGTLFVADNGFSSGVVYANVTNVDLSGVTNPAPESCYYVCRYHSVPFTYKLPRLTPGGHYTARLHFNEALDTAGVRKFDIQINGNTVEHSFDIEATAGSKNKAVIKEYSFVADVNGRVAITLVPIAGYDTATICAIEIVGNSSVPTLATLTWDDNGNRTLVQSPAGNISYTWDAQDRLVGISHPIAGNYSMTYDYSGLRVAQQSGDGSQSSYAYVGTDVHAWQRGSTLTHLVVRGEGHIRSIGIQADGTALNRQFHADGLGGTVATSGGDQSIETRYQTDAWGNVQSGTATDNPFVYGGGEGYWQEAELGLTYVQARWLDTQTGSWLSVDPVSGEPRYSYAHNSPTAYTDPTGTQSGWFDHDWWEAFWHNEIHAPDPATYRKGKTGQEKIVPRVLPTKGAPPSSHGTASRPSTPARKSGSGQSHGGHSTSHPNTSRSPIAHSSRTKNAHSIPSQQTENMTGNAAWPLNAEASIQQENKLRNEESQAIVANELERGLRNHGRVDYYFNRPKWASGVPDPGFDAGTIAKSTAQSYAVGGLALISIGAAAAISLPVGVVAAAAWGAGSFVHSMMSREISAYDAALADPDHDYLYLDNMHEKAAVLSVGDFVLVTPTLQGLEHRDYMTGLPLDREASSEQIGSALGGLGLWARGGAIMTATKGSIDPYNSFSRPSSSNRVIFGSYRLPESYINSLKSSNNALAVLADDDPVIDNNILSWIMVGDTEALRFAQRRNGLLSVTDTAITEQLQRPD